MIARANMEGSTSQVIANVLIERWVRAQRPNA